MNVYRYVNFPGGWNQDVDIERYIQPMLDGWVLRGVVGWLDVVVDDFVEYDDQVEYYYCCCPTGATF